MYLTIITTVLVLTQIIRVTQNHIQLKGMKKVERSNEILMQNWINVIDRLNDVLDTKEIKGK